MTDTQRGMARHALGLFALLLSSCGWNGRQATVNGRVIYGDTLLNVAANSGMSVTCVPSPNLQCCLDCKLTPAEPPRILK